MNVTPTHRKKRRSLLLATLIVAPLFAGILYTIQQQHRTLSKRLICASNLKGVGTAVKIYASEADALPEDTLQRLVAEGVLKPESTVCPVSGKPYIHQPTTVLDVDPTTAIAFEPLSYHGGKGANVLFADGHAAFVLPDEFNELMNRMNGRANQPRRP